MQNEHRDANRYTAIVHFALPLTRTCVLKKTTIYRAGTYRNMLPPRLITMNNN